MSSLGGIAVEYQDRARVQEVSPYFFCFGVEQRSGGSVGMLEDVKVRGDVQVHFVVVIHVEVQFPFLAQVFQVCGLNHKHN